MLPALARDEVLRRAAGHEHRSGDVGGEDRLEAGEIEIHEVFENAEAGVVDENIEVAEFFEDFAISALDVGFPGDVRMNCVDAEGAGGFRELALVTSGDRTRAPLAARDCAMARPMPLLPPVINATAFRKFILPPEGIRNADDCTALAGPECAAEAWRWAELEYSLR